jgi:hypothetical protein
MKFKLSDSLTSSPAKRVAPRVPPELDRLRHGSPALRDRDVWLCCVGPERLL